MFPVGPTDRRDISSINTSELPNSGNLAITIDAVLAVAGTGEAVS
ncbi:hypothetical protein Bmyc01_29860 [Bacillus mycoides]|nr:MULTISPECIES: hypothetical protein [Bacillus]MED1510826.1 hypothetical protein [Bacillus proteolyticus]GLV64316.1 hypothetical protein Bmyc01_29860 [Bacillus mycoides]